MIEKPVCVGHVACSLPSYVKNNLSSYNKACEDEASMGGFRHKSIQFFHLVWGPVIICESSFGRGSSRLFKSVLQK